MLQTFVLKQQTRILCVENRLQSTIYSISILWNRNNKGPRMDPYGTSHRRLTEVDNLFWTLTWNYLPDRYGLYQSITSCENSKDSIFRSNILWSKVSNAFWRSIKIIPYNANSLTSGGRHPHFKGFTRLSKQLPFLLHFYLTKHINEKWIVNTVFFANQIEIWDTVFQKCSHTYPIDKDMSLTFWLMWLSLFVFLWLFFPLKFSC